MRTALLKTTIALCALSVLPCLAHADESAQQSSQPDARAMLGVQIEPGTVEKKVGAGDFAWAKLTNGGPANGSSPVVGAGSGKAYYDFKDGLPHPYYIVPKK